MSEINEPAFDWDQASTLLGDNPNEVEPEMAEIARQLVVDADGQFQDLKALNPETDRKAISSQAHGLRGCLLNFGFTGVGALLHKVEKEPYASSEYLGLIAQAEATFIASKKLLAERYPGLGIV